MKAGKSSATAIVLPSLATYCLVVSNVASSVAIPRMSSTSSISGTGFMKWMPMKRSGRSVAEASRVIEIDEVLLPTMASALSTGHTLAKIARLVSSFSVAASMTRSQSPKASSVSAGVMRLSAACRSSSVMRLRLTCRAMLPLMVAIPALIRSAERSLSLTSNPERDFGRSLTSIMLFRLLYRVPAGKFAVGLASTSDFAEFRRQFRKRLVQVSDQTKVGHLEDWRLFILVDSHNDFRILHTGEMLDRAGNPNRDVKFRCHNLPGLAHLPVVRRIAGINRRARGADGGPKLISDRLNVFSEVFPTLHGAPPRNDDFRRGELGALRFG